jgi:hypothetical protein
MKRTLACGAALLLATLTSTAQPATAFTYQGRLTDTNGPAAGLHDFVFALYDANDYQIGPLITNTSVPVVDGQFTQLLDFGTDAFRRVFFLSPRGHYEGPGEWLEIAVRKTSSGHPASFVTLVPRQHLTPAPYAAALTMPLASSALEGAYSGEVYFSNVTNRFRGQFMGDGSGLSNLPPSSLAGPIPESGLSSNVALRAGGNAFSGNQTVMSGDVGLGTAAPEAKLDVRSKIVSQGGSGNVDNLVFKKTLPLGTLNAEMVFSHRASGAELWLYGNNGINGYRNLQGWYYASNAVRFPADGQTLYIDEGLGRVGVGRKPVADVLEVGGDMSVWGNLTVSGGQVFQGDLLASRLIIGANQVLSGSYATIAGGQENTNSGTYAAIGGGWRNFTDSSYATVSGGRNNISGALYSSVVGGSFNVADGYHATVAGGYTGQASGYYSIVLGGSHNVAMGDYSLAAGGYATAAHDNSFLWNGDSDVARTSTGEKRFEVYAPGGARFYTGTNPLYSSGEMSCAMLTIRGGADLAEPFTMSESTVAPGAVVVIDPDHPGRLKLSTRAYDHKVAGIISGAGGVRPGISMIQAEALEGGHNVALSGRVYALVDASTEPVEPGDLLTTSGTPGHAMKAVDAAKAQGAILGKAMSRLEKDRGLVLVLVSLQ